MGTIFLFMSSFHLHSLFQEHNQDVEQGLGACWNVSADSMKHSLWPSQSFGPGGGGIPHFKKPENSVSWEAVFGMRRQAV